MSWIALVFIALTLIMIISQFGKRLAARNSIIWWSVGLFIILVAAAPQLLLPLIHALGIQLVSNFVLAGLIMFLFLQVLELTAESTTSHRTIRKLVSTLAADEFIHKIGGNLAGKSDYKARVLVLLPTYNEEEAIVSTWNELQRAFDSFDGSIQYKVCFVNDGSVDRSQEILENVAPESFTSHSVNIGVAGAIMTGFSIARRINADYVVQFDSDGQHPAHKIDEMIRHAIQEKMDLVIGSRFVPASTVIQNDHTASTTKSRIFGILVIRRMLTLFGARAKIKDPTSGFRVYSRYAQDYLFKQMPDEYPEPESIAILAMSRARIGELRVEMEARATGVSSINGLKSIRFMAKVLTALLGLRIRTLFAKAS